jgi:hypothetical protein
VRFVEGASPINVVGVEGNLVQHAASVLCDLRC